MSIPNYITEDESFYYCPKDNVNDIKEYENFIPLSDLLENSVVSSAYYNIIGTLKEQGKTTKPVIVI